MIIPDLPFSFRRLGTIRGNLFENPTTFVVANIILILPCLLATYREGHFNQMAAINMAAALGPFMVYYLLQKKSGIYELLSSISSGVARFIAIFGFGIFYSLALTLVLIDPVYCEFIWIPLILASPIFAFYLVERRR